MNAHTASMIEALDELDPDLAVMVEAVELDYVHVFNLGPVDPPKEAA